MHYGSGSVKAKICGSGSGSGSTTLTGMQEIYAKNEHAIDVFMSRHWIPFSWGTVLNLVAKHFETPNHQYIIIT